MLFRSGGVLVTVVSIWISQHAKDLPHLGLPFGLGTDAPATWRYLLMTGLLPAIPIALLLPFVPESKVWRERRAAGTLKRPSFGALFAPELRRVTLVTAALSACAYGIAFGALQVTVARVTPGLPELKEQAKALAPLRKEAEELNKQLNELPPIDPARKELIGQIKANFGKQKPINDEVKKMADQVQFRQEMGGLAGRILLAILLIVGLSRVTLLKVFQVPALVVLPLTYFSLFAQGGEAFLWAYAVCGLLTVAQFSYFGEYLPRVFPIHLRGTGTFRPVSPVVFVTLAEGISACEVLAGAVRTGPLAVDLQFPYHPHVTVAPHLDDTALDRAFDELADFECRFSVDSFSLYVHDADHGWKPTCHYDLG